MHPITFAIKRTFQGSLRITRPWFAHFRLTPARFDMLFAIHHNSTRGCVQSQLGCLLGVTAPTISRMLASLEKLGFITRTRDPLDRRGKNVHLTKEGFRLIRLAIDETLPKIAQLIVDSAFVDRWRDRHQISANLAHLAQALERAREQFRDTAWLNFRWIPPY
jgi:DNA-binding MarR family transcriptional regulator